jgi:hypothetical protein
MIPIIKDLRTQIGAEKQKNPMKIGDSKTGGETDERFLVVSELLIQSAS